MPLVHTVDSVIEAVSSFSSLADQLKQDKRFLCCNRSIYVNMDWIREAGDMDLVLKNGEHLPMRVRGRAQIKKDYLRYMLRELREMIKQFDFKSLRPILVMLAVSIFSVTVILVLYFYNNRYMGEAGQPSCGILDLSGEGEAASGLRWLVKGWEYYEGELLGPEDFADGKAGNRNL